MDRTPARSRPPRCNDDGSVFETLISVIAIGLLVGTKHATEADHLAAVATLATRYGTLPDALRQGAAWGLGHTLTLLLFGGVVLVLVRTIPAGVEMMMELAVGLMLVALGTDVLRRLRRQRVHIHRHAHADGEVHLHAHSHETNAASAAPAAAQTPDFARMSFSLVASPAHRDAAHVHPHPGPTRPDCRAGRCWWAWSTAWPVPPH